MASERTKLILQMCTSRFDNTVENESKGRNKDLAREEVNEPNYFQLQNVLDLNSPNEEVTNEEANERDKFDNLGDPIDEYANCLFDECVDDHSEVDDSDKDRDFQPEIDEQSSSNDESVHLITANITSNKKIDDTVLTPTSKKKNFDSEYTRKKRQERKTKRNTGQEYKTVKGIVKKARERKKLLPCRMKCADRIPEKIQEDIFKEYWSLGTRDKRVNFVASLTEAREPKTRRIRSNNLPKKNLRKVTHEFHFKINGQRKRVCRTCFMKTLGETQMFVTIALSNASSSTSGITEDDRRGRHSPSNKHTHEILEDVINHINSFPAYESHYTRRENNKKYLAPHLTLTIMYKLYCEDREKVVSRKIYEREFHKMKLAFKQPKVDTCHKCDVLHMKLKVCDNEDEKKTIEEEKNLHHQEADVAYLKKKSDKNMATEDSSIKCFAFDLQQCLPTPFVNSSVSFYKRQLWTYNLTIHDLGTGEVTCFMWHEAEGGRGANQIATCLFLHLVNLPPDIKRIVLYSDTCGGQNKNSHVAAMFLYLMQQNKNIEYIDHKFMVSGHSHMECDVDHSLIEKQKKKLSLPIEHPHDWYQLVRTVGKKRKFVVRELTHDMFLDFASLYKGPLLLRKKDIDGSPFKWHDARWLRYTNEPATLYFKTNLEDEQLFKSLSLHRRGKPQKILEPRKCYTSSPPIAVEKKNNLLELLPLINPVFKTFYLSLKTSNNVECNYPDVEEFDDDS